MEGHSCSRFCRGVCGTCKPISKEFKKVLNLKDSGLTIYVHNTKDEENQKPSPTDKKQDKIVLHNTTDKDLKRSDYIKELSKYKTQCFRCNTVLQQIHGLLDEVKEIRENEVRVVCQYCKAPNFTGQCSRCHYLVNKFVTTKVKEYDQRIQRFDEWLSKVKHILHAILEDINRAKGKSTIQQDLASSDELEKLLLELKTPLKITSRQPRIRQLLEIRSVSSAANIAESKEILETLLDRFKSVTKPDFKTAEEVKSGSSTITLPPIKTVFKVLPKKSVDSAFTLLPPSSEMLPIQKSLLKGTVPLKKQTQFVDRDRDIDHARGRYPKQDRGADQYTDEHEYQDQDIIYRKGDRSRGHKQYGDKYRYEDKYRGQDSGQGKMQTSERIAIPQAKQDARRYQYTDEDQYQDQDFYRKGDRSKRRKQYGDKYLGQDRGQRKVQTSGTIDRPLAEQNAVLSKEQIKDEKLETKDKEDLEEKEEMKEDSTTEDLRRVARSQAEKDAKHAENLDKKEKEEMKEDLVTEDIGRILQAEQGEKPAKELAKDKNKMAEGLWPKEPLPEETSSDILIKRAQHKRHTVEVAYKKQSLTQIEGFEIPKETKESKTYVTRKPIFSIGLVKNGETLPPTALEDDEIKIRTSSSESVEVGKIGKMGRYTKGRNTEGEKKNKIAIDGNDGDYAKGKTKLKGKKKRVRSDESESDESDISDKENRKKSPSKRVHLKQSASTKLLLKLLKKREMEKREAEKASKMKQKVIKMPFIAKLPEVKYSKKPTYYDDSRTLVEATVECETDMVSLEMIKGTKVIKYDPHCKDRQPEGVVPPLLFRAQPVCRIPPEAIKPSLPTPTVPDQTTCSKQVVMNFVEAVEQSAELKGVLKYALSNRDFIENGYTLLPTIKLMRKENIYKMIPANPEYDWFERHKKRILFYESGEKLAEIDEGGHGRWYYKNGILALNYYKAEEVNAGNRYIIYSSGQSYGFDQGQERELEPITILASFDHSGNGVVYDQHGKVRIKYNQTEGVVMDKKIGPKTRWKWHDLNDPPDLRPVFVDNYLEHLGACLEKLLKRRQFDKQDEDKVRLVTENSTKMLNIELDNFIKDEAHKMLQEYRPFQIRMKALRINNEFSLKVIDQANIIYLLFRSGQVSFKLNLGMVLISNEILDSDIVEASQISTPYDRVLPRSESVADIKRILEITRKRSRRRNDKFARNSVVSSDDSTDQMKSKSSCIKSLLSSKC